MPPKAKPKNNSPADDTKAAQAPAEAPKNGAPAIAPAPIAKAEPKNNSPAGDAECAVVLTKEAALGNGTRRKGEAICSIRRGEDGHLDFDSAIPAEGVEQVELDTAFNNLHLLDVLSATPVAPE